VKRMKKIYDDDDDNNNNHHITVTFYYTYTHNSAFRRIPICHTARRETYINHHNDRIEGAVYPRDIVAWPMQDDAVMNLIKNTLILFPADDR